MKLKSLSLVAMATLAIAFTGCQKEPEAMASVDKSIYDVNESVAFKNSTVDGDSYEWEFGDGTKSTEHSPSHSYTKSGTYTAKVTAYSKNGKKSDESTVTVKVGERYLTRITVKHVPNLSYWDGTSNPDVKVYFGAQSSPVWNVETSENSDMAFSVPFYWSVSNVKLSNETWELYMVDVDVADEEIINSWTFNPTQIGGSGKLSLVDNTGTQHIELLYIVQ